MVLQTWQLIVVALASWLNRQQQDVVAYLREENRVLREQLGGKRIRFTDDQRWRIGRVSSTGPIRVSSGMMLIVELFQHWFHAGRRCFEEADLARSRAAAEFWDHTPTASPPCNLSPTTRPASRNCPEKRSI